MRAHLNRNFVWINQRSFESSPGGLGIAWTSLTPVKRSDEGGTGTESTLLYGMYKLQVENWAQKLLPGCCWEWEMVNLSRCRLDLDADTDIVGLLMRLFSNWVACPLGGGLEHRGLNSLHLWGRVCVWSWSPTLLPSTCLLDLQAHPPGLPVQPRWARPQAYPRLGLYAIVKIWRKGTKSQRGLHLNDAQSE